ncbi:hypothetical protein CSA56_09675 [candidate division KSB3 bacterium]|uniref:Type II secretion system protein GspG C-terminal domain-containing protein n=1 Tax=candidate division KSB3 bacterium TaxID=2044937 RepID=A0A2G6KE85_9BACT|nr:MAG: hypothetical protein CSA56_09675 [candidate division KSB3 bacterium]
MRQKGFTLIELLIVVTIIGLLAGIAIPRFAKVYEKAKDKKVITDMRNIAVAIGIYRIEHGSAPITDDATVLVDELRNYTDASAPLNDYDVWGNKYVYQTDDDGTRYTLLSYGKDKTSGPSWATMDNFDADADTLVVNGIFRASHGGSTVVAY